MRFTAQLAGLAGVPAALAAFGVPAAPLLAKVGLTVADLAAADRRVDVQIADDLIGLCLRATGSPHFGLIAGSRGRGVGSAGFLGAAARNANSVGDALADITQSGELNDPMGLHACRVNGEDAIFSYALQAPSLAHPDQFYDLILALMRQAMRDLLGPRWMPELVYLPRRRPRDLQPYHDALGPHLKFDALRAGLLFPADLLTATIPGAEPARRQAALRSARHVSEKREPKVCADARRAIRAAMEDGRCTRAEVARRLGLHERAFARRLQSHGAKFQDILDSTRMNVARELLSCTRVPVGRIALAIGYEDATVFGRAFCRRVGMPPTAFRKQALRRQ